MNHCCIGGVTYARFNVIICADISVKINENGKLKKSMSTQEYNSGSVNNFFLSSSYSLKRKLVILCLMSHQTEHVIKCCVVKHPNEDAF